MGDMIAALWEARARFCAHGDHGHDTTYWLNMLESQVKEARAHTDDDARIREFCDMVLVAFCAIDDLRGNPEQRVADRIRARVLPRIPELTALYLANGGHKGQPVQGAK